MPLPLKALLDLGETPVSGFLLPGHVSVITGTACYEFLARDYGVAGVVAGFEAHDVLEALLMLVRQPEPAIDIEYTRAVQPEGNVVAQRLLEQVFAPSDADWRGLGVIPGSGLAIRDEYAAFDAGRRFDGRPRTLAGAGRLPLRRGAARPHRPGRLCALRRALHAGGSGGRLHGLERGRLRGALSLPGDR